MNNKLQTIDYNKLGPMETKILDIWASGVHQPYDVVKVYNEKYAIEDGIRRIRIKDVSNAIRKIKRLILKESVDDLKTIIYDEYFVLYNEALQSWLNSKEDEVVVTETREETDKGFKEAVVERRKPQTGDSRHLANAAKMLQSLRELSGVDAPKKIEHILKEEMVLVMEYLESALKPELYSDVLLALQNYGGSDNLVIDVESEEM